MIDDDNDIICWLDIKQVDKTKVTEDSTNILYLIIGNEQTPDKYLEYTALKILDLTTKYCGGNGRIIR